MQEERTKEACFFSGTKIVIKEETDGYKLTSKGNPSSYPVEQYVVYVFISLFKLR